MTGNPGHTDPARAAPDAEGLLERARMAGDRGQPARAVALCRRALAALAARTPPSPQARSAAGGATGTGAERAAGRSLRVRITVTLSYNLAELGRAAESIELLGEAAAIASGAEAAALQASRGLIYARVGDTANAMADLNGAVAGLAGNDREDLARTLLNRGLLHMTTGDLAAAQSDTARAEVAAAAAGSDTVVFMARYNLGYLRFLAGDLPGSLRAMAEAQELAPDAALGVPALDRARVLLAAGLLGEAGEQAQQAITTFTANRAMTDLTDALLVAADIAITAGDPARARALARRAARISVRRSNTAAELLARLAEQRAAAAQRRARGPRSRRGSVERSRMAARDAIGLAEHLDSAGRAPEAVTARLLAVEALLDGDDHPAAAAIYQQLTGAMRSMPLAGRVQGRLMGARVALAEGRRTDGLRRLRRGLDDLGRFQALLGSQDLQTASSVWGRQLAAVGLRTAVETGSPAQILHWLERSRATSTRLPHLRPPADPALAADLAALRIADAAARSAVLAGRADPDREHEVADLRRRIRARTWTLAGSGTATGPPTLRSVQRALAAARPTPQVLGYFHGAGSVHAVTVTATSARYLRLAPLAACEEAVRVVAADLDLLATDRVPAGLRAVATRSLAAALRELSDRLVAPVLRHAAGPVLISGAGPLGAVPWPMLPALAGRAVSVTTSVSASVAGLAARPDPYRQGVLAVAGPRLDRAGQEVRAVIDRYPGAAALTGAAATGSAVLGDIPAGGLLHIAAHGHHEPDSPLFSSVLLADGPLFAYDIAPNRSLPDQIVLSSCDVGRIALRGGAEPLGLAVALLRSGVRTVLAAVAPVADRAAERVMTAYHAGLAAGKGAAAALADAVPLAGEAPAPFCCFGAGGAGEPADAAPAAAGVTR